MLQLNYSYYYDGKEFGMGYRLKRDESVPAGIRRVVEDEVDDAAGQLSGKGQPDRDQAIHEARKNVKRIRGVMRLIRPQLGRTFTVENTRFRDIGRQLSAFRDAGAMLETFDLIQQKYPRDAASIRCALMRKKEQEEHVSGIDEVLAKLASELQAAKKKIKHWPLKTGGFRGIEPGLRQTFKAGGRAMTRARLDPLPGNFHEWRKRVKDHWYHIRLLEELWGDEMAAYEKSLKDLETCLGEDHNLVVLREKIISEPDFYGTGDDIALFLADIGELQTELRQNAVSLGERIYAEKPRQFTNRVGVLWQAWRTHSVAV